MLMGLQFDRLFESTDGFRPLVQRPQRDGEVIEVRAIPWRPRSDFLVPTDGSVVRAL
jgi:hypothetical protein